MDTGESFEVDGKWELPPEIPETIVTECRRWLAAHDAASGIAQEGRIKHWLMKLLGGLPGDYSPEVVQMKMGAFVFAVNDKPAYCFDDVTLKIAMRRFKFWPSSAELIAFAEEMDEWTRRTAARAFKVSDAGPRTAGSPHTRRPWAQGGEEDNMRWNREQADREREELAKIAGQQDRPGEWDRLPGEEAHAFIDRIGDKRRKMLDEITRRMKGVFRAPLKRSDKPAPPPTTEQMRQSAEEFRKTHEHGPPMAPNMETTS